MVLSQAPGAVLRTAQIELQVGRQSLGSAAGINAAYLALSGDDQVTFGLRVRSGTHQSIVMFDPRAMTITQPRLENQHVIKECWRMELDVHRTDHQHDSRLLDLSIGNAGRAQHLNTSPLKEIEILRIVHTALSIDFMIMDSDRNFVFGYHR